MKPDLMTDAVLLARARGGRNKRHSRRHALRLTLLVHFADENYPKAGRNPFETWTIFIRDASEIFTMPQAASIEMLIRDKEGAGSGCAVEVDRTWT
jgi:hypothetical protein